MKKAFLLLSMLLMSGSAVQANGLHHRLSSSIQLTTNAASSQAIRVGNSYAISGTGVDTKIGEDTDYIGSLATHSSGTAANPVVIAEQKTAGAAFSFSQSYTAGDALGSAINVGSNPVFGNLTTVSVGSGTGTGTVTSQHVVTATGGGTGTVTTGQFVSEITLN